MKKRPAKKNAPTPKRKYTPRKKKEHMGEKDNGGGAGNEDNVLFHLEKVDLVQYMHRRTTRRLEAEKEKIAELLEKMKIGEGFNVKKSWTKYVHNIIQENKMKIIVRTFPIAGNAVYRKVIRFN